MKQILLGTVLFSVFFIAYNVVVPVSSETEIEIIVYGEGCISCFTGYVDRLENALIEVGLPPPSVKYIDDNPKNRVELEAIEDNLNVPEEFRGEVVVIMNGEYLFINYVPVTQIMSSISRIDGSDILLVYSNKLEQVNTVLTYSGNLYECYYLSDFMDCIKVKKSSSSFSSFFIVFTSGLIDGINPCAFTVLLFFIALIQSFSSLESDNQRLTLKIGGVYILSVFISYLAIGLAILRAVTLVGMSYYLNIIGTSIMFIIGLLNIKDYFYPNIGPSVKLSEGQWSLVRRYMREISIPATIVTGFLVSVFEFPCTGGVYLSVIGLLAKKVSFNRGLLFLILYNVAFIIPLFTVFIIAYIMKSNQFSLRIWKKNERTIRLFTGIFFIFLALLMRRMQIY